MDGKDKGKKDKRRLGRGLDALISGVETGNEAEPALAEPALAKAEPALAKAEKVGEASEAREVSGKVEVNEAAFREAVEQGMKNPRVVLWSVEASTVLRYLKKTVPEFSISDEAAKILEEGLRKRYPHLWEYVSTEKRRKGKTRP